jgi:enoyl-CoA hydratase
MIVAASSARVGQPEVNLGIIPVFGGTQRLIERCGLGTARRLVLTGEIIDADEALKLGIVDKVVDPAELMNVARAWGGLIASKGPLAIAAAKKVMRQYSETALVSGLRREVSSFLEVFASKDCGEGMSAFAKKRPAAFKGK